MKEHDANANAIIFARAGCGDEKGQSYMQKLYPRLAAKSAIVSGSRAAKLLLSSFCIKAALKDTAFVLGCSINDFMPEEELRIYSRLRF